MRTSRLAVFKRETTKDDGIAPDVSQGDIFGQ